MKKAILFAAVMMIAANGCKTSKQVHTVTKKTDSSAVAKNNVLVSSQTKDSSSEYDIAKLFHSSDNKDVTIGNIKTTETETPDTKDVFEVPFDSLKKSGDTLTAIGKNGTKVNLFVKDGKLFGGISKKGQKKKTTELSNVTIKTEKNIDSSLLAAKKQANTTTLKDSTTQSEDSVNIEAKTKDKTSNLLNKPTFFSGIGVMVLIGLGIVLVVVVIKYWTKIKSWIPWI